jgi:hypothetical protein
MQHFTTSEYHNPFLLDLYFAGLREKSPLIQFKNFYNIIEYVFEDAVIEECKRHLSIGEAALINDLSDYEKWKEKLDNKFRYDKNKLKSEDTQLKISINMFVEKTELVGKIMSLDSTSKDHFLKPATLTKDLKIPPLNLNDDNLLNNYSKRIYLIRNSVIHTKRRVHGKMVPAILPFSLEEGFLEEEIYLLKFCAQKIIHREKDIFQYTPMGFSPAEILLLLHMLSENKNYETFVKNLGLFLKNLNSKIKGEKFYPYLDMIIFLWLEIFDEIRLKNPEKIESLSKDLQKIDLQSLEETTQCALKCLISIMQNDIDKFYSLVDRLPLMTMRANLYRLSTSICYNFEKKRKDFV